MKAIFGSYHTGNLVFSIRNDESGTYILAVMQLTGKATWPVGNNPELPKLLHEFRSKSMDKLLTPEFQEKFTWKAR